MGRVSGPALQRSQPLQGASRFPRCSVRGRNQARNRAEKCAHARQPYRVCSLKQLTVSLIAFAIGSVAVFGNPGIPVGWTVAMPLGAVSFGLFLVTFLLQKEVAKFDEEERARLELAERHAVRTAKSAGIAVVSTDTNLSPAHSH